MLSRKERKKARKTKHLFYNKNLNKILVKFLYNIFTNNYFLYGLIFRKCQKRNYTYPIKKKNSQ